MKSAVKVSTEGDEDVQKGRKVCTGDPGWLRMGRDKTGQQHIHALAQGRIPGPQPGNAGGRRRKKRKVRKVHRGR